MSIRNPLRFPNGVRTVGQLLEWLGKAAPGDALEYYAGTMNRETDAELKRVFATVRRMCTPEEVQDSAGRKPPKTLPPRLLHFTIARGPADVFGNRPDGWSHVVAVPTAPLAQAIAEIPLRRNVIRLDQATRNRSLAKERIES